MPKKKPESVPIVPITLEEYEAMLETWNKVKPYLVDLGRATSTRETTKYDYYPNYDSHWPDGYHGMDEKGIYFYHIESRQYDEGHEAVIELIPLEAILHPQETIDAAEKIKMDVVTRQHAKQRENELANYERLKKQFGDI